MPELTFAGYMMAAMDACRYVKHHMKTGAANNPLKELDRGPIGHLEAWLTVKSERSDIDLTILRRGVKEWDINGTMEVWAEKAKTYGAGNCGEQSALAFSYLKGRRVQPIDWAHFNNRDHAFVLVNRPKDLINGKLKEKLDQVILCDPYYQRTGTLSEFPEYNVEVIGLLLHMEGGVVMGA
jgi:hypothetical protein